MSSTVALEGTVRGFEATEVVTLPDDPPLSCTWRVPGGAS